MFIFRTLLSFFLALKFTQLKFKDKNDMDRKYLDAVKGNNSSKFDENGMKIGENRIFLLTGIFF